MVYSIDYTFFFKNTKKKRINLGISLLLFVFPDENNLRTLEG